jgi:lipooligosaccharide transport system permease protein
MLNSIYQFFGLCLNITRRNWVVYKKDLFANISPSLADPSLILVSLGLGLGSYVSEVKGMSYIQFLAPGLPVLTTLFTSFFETSYGFYVRMTFENVFKAMLTTPMQVHHIVIGEFMWVGFKGSIMAIGVSIVLLAFGLFANPLLLPLIAIVGFLAGISCGGLGLIASGIVRNINQFQTVYSYLISPLYFLSGIFFPIEQMPTALRWANEFFPLIHAVRMSSAIFWNKNVAENLALHGGILAIQSVVFGFIGYRMIYKKLVS